MCAAWPGTWTAAGWRNKAMTSPAGVTALPARWADRHDFVILDASFGQGQRFLRTWADWRADPRRCRRLVCIALGVDGLARADEAAPSQQAGSRRLKQAWPVLTPGLHTLVFDEAEASQVTLLLGVGALADLVPQLVAAVDAFWLDGVPPAPLAVNGDEGWLSRLARLAAPGATAIASPHALNVLAGLAQSGFKPEAASELPRQDADPVHLRFAPRHTPPPLAGGLWPTALAPEHRHALVIGAGLAGCAAAWGLARQGWRITLVDAKAGPAQGASGNPGGLFHSILHGEDGLHARAHRAAALRTAAVVSPWLAERRFAGGCQGLLRLDTGLHEDAAHALATRLGLPPGHVQWLNQAAAREVAGMPVPHGGWLFHQGGWVDPAGYARALLEEARRHAEVGFMPDSPVCRLERSMHGDQAWWQAIGAQGRLIAQAPVVVLAGAVDSSALIQALPGTASLPLSPVRGQISHLPLQDGIRAPHIPVAGAGYVLPVHGGRLMFGATSGADDTETGLREADHLHNLAQAVQLGSLPAAFARTLPPGIQGRVGWRAITPDRLPYIGPLPLAALPAKVAGQKTPRTDQARFVPRFRDAQGGVHVITGFGSRGITWAALAGELLASWVTGSPSPVEAVLRDALDPARIVTRTRAKDLSG
nr:putative lipoprotein [uncultured bacterium]